jgi:hypothetical protein
MHRRHRIGDANTQTLTITDSSKIRTFLACQPPKKNALLENWTDLEDPYYLHSTVSVPSDGSAELEITYTYHTKHDPAGN